MKALVLAALLGVPAWAAQAAERSWEFDVRLDGKPIGSHRFTLSQQGDERLLRSVADFSVKVLGWVAYRYQHEGTERWRGECLSRLDASTLDDGKRIRVQARHDTAGLQVQVNGEPAPVQAGCLMSFAYWNPALLALAPTRLLNAQNGRIEAVQITRLADAPIELRGTPQVAQHWRITGIETPIELWYSTQGEWLALDAQVRGGRVLQYRLRLRMNMHNTRQLLTAYAACAASFLLLDACWLTVMGERLYRPALGALVRPDFDGLAAALFYPLYLAGVVGFAVLPALTAAQAKGALVRGAAFGLICYATYDLTNQATLRGWPWHVTVIDLAWGSVATALAAGAGRRAAARHSDADQ